MPKLLISAQEMHARIKELADDIIDSHGDDQALALIGIQRRGVVIARMLAEHMAERLGREPLSGSLDIALYRDDWSTKSSNPAVGETRIHFDVQDKTLILVDDVFFTGRTVRAALEALIDFGRPGRVELLVLVDRGHRELPIRADYVGKNVPTSFDEIVKVYLDEVDGINKVTIEQRAAN